jgi:hypothetical protein
VGRILVGLLLGIVAAAAILWARRIDPRDPCLSRCSAETRCTEGRCVPVVAQVAPAAPEHKRRHRKGGDAPSAEPEVTLKPGDERVVSDGDALGRPEHVDFAKDGDEGHELSQDDLDRGFHAIGGGITRCITEALGDAPLERGRVEVAFRVESSGVVSRVRLSGPQLLFRRGLTRCVRPQVTALQFPHSGGASVVTYPFQLQ